MYITILAFDKLHGSKPLVPDAIVKLRKEPDNKYDSEAIACEMRYFGKIGYISNSTRTVARGTMSAGRLYDKISEEYFARIRFVIDNTAIAEVLSTEELTKEMANQDSDVHFLCDDLSKLELKEE